MYSSVFREWKVAALFVGGICLFVGAYFAEGGGYEQLEFGRKEAPKPAPIAALAPAPRRAAPSAAHFTSDEELAAAYADPSEAAPTPSAAADPNQPPSDGIAPPEAGAVPGDAPAAGPSAVPAAPADQGR